jgi:hypothetical protein
MHSIPFHPVGVGSISTVLTLPLVCRIASRPSTGSSCLPAVQAESSSSASDGWRPILHPFSIYVSNPTAKHRLRGCGGPVLRSQQLFASSYYTFCAPTTSSVVFDLETRSPSSMAPVEMRCVRSSHLAWWLPNRVLRWADGFGMHQVARNRRRLVKETNLPEVLIGNRSAATIPCSAFSPLHPKQVCMAESPSSSSKCNPQIAGILPQFPNVFSIKKTV